MAPAEIYQGGILINRIAGNQEHVGKLNGITVHITNAYPKYGCDINTTHLPAGDSITLDGGEIVKSIAK